jgi:DNA-binding response OmpR family regulator
MSKASILLVEDEAFIRMMLVDMVQDIGHQVVAEAGSVDEGCLLAKREEYDLAIIDINLNGMNASPVAEAVAGRGLPFLFLSGYGSKGIPAKFKGAPWLPKPCSPDTLKQKINSILSTEKRADISNDRSDEP